RPVHPPVQLVDLQQRRRQRTTALQPVHLRTQLRRPPRQRLHLRAPLPDLLDQHRTPPRHLRLRRSQVQHRDRRRPAQQRRDQHERRSPRQPTPRRPRLARASTPRRALGVTRVLRPLGHLTQESHRLVRTPVGHRRTGTRHAPAANRRTCATYCTPANQYRPTPHHVNAQPTTCAVAPTQPGTSASSSSGNAYSSANVATLPTMLTFSVPYPRRASTGTVSASITSRATITSTSHSGTTSRHARPIRVTKMNNRSASGSSICPSRVTWFSRRASTPSNQS